MFQRTICRLFFAALFATWFGDFLSLGVVHAGFVTDFDDVSFWVGDGRNQAVLAIDWDGRSDQDNALVWGYRWNGTAKTQDMFEAVVAADQRLFAKTNSSPSNVAVYGIGYDANGDGVFKISDGSAFGSNGRTESSAPFMSATTGAEDVYKEGWMFSYWHHAWTSGAAVGGRAQWSSGAGISNRTLTDGGWDSLAYNSNTNVELLVPSLPFAAEDTSHVGDYSHNGAIDAADFSVWRDTRGQAPFLPGYGADGNHDGSIDKVDYRAWAAAFTGDEPAGVLVPEPKFAAMLAWIALIMIRILRKSN